MASASAEAIGVDRMVQADRLALGVRGRLEPHTPRGSRHRRAEESREVDDAIPREATIW